MTLRDKLHLAVSKLEAGGFDVRPPDYDESGKENIRWIFDESGNQIGCIKPSTDKKKINVTIEF